MFGGIFGRYLGIILGHIWEVFPHPLCEVLFIILYIPLLFPPPSSVAVVHAPWTRLSARTRSYLALWRRSTFALH